MKRRRAAVSAGHTVGGRDAKRRGEAELPSTETDASAACKTQASRRKNIPAGDTPTGNTPAQPRKAIGKGRGSQKAIPVRGGVSIQALNPAREVADIEDLSSKTFSNEEVVQFRRELLNWYDANHRNLPWRVNPPTTAAGNGAAKRSGISSNEFAYQVWVSEIMLQQTQVSTVIDYFNKWVGRWPTVQRLAHATQEEVNEVWAGLGYYRRARYLLDGAKYVVDKLGGRLPETVDELLAIPGIGPYTAAAVASIAFGHQAAAVDGNVIRVLCRLRAMGGDWSKRPLSGHIAGLAQRLLDPERPGDCNQALMELGAMQCVKSGQVECGSCPVREICWAHDQSLQDPSVKVSDWPKRAAKIEKRQETARATVLHIETKGEPPCLAFVQRPATGVLAGLWEFPTLTLPSPGSSPESFAGVMDSYLEILFGPGILTQITKREELGEFHHLFSHIRLTVTAECLVVKLTSTQRQELSTRVAGQSPGSPKLQLIPLQEFQPSNMSKVVQKVFELEKRAAHSSGKR
eukprot:CAMPEP_0117652132 /NCGR_PEP_ID=MMETSP0804-20121206/2464_1 /TAXON_ID=1074897 /ORGANISM="Tetraselmis astigmatica, Strain CCMP880" /LENGTH=517 /DNA_ID=CAMNT_0005458159 /DNA_START=317 /DNA_END=1870 /DNA_ORIENTATION=+